MVLAQAERVAGGHLGAAVRRPRRPALSPATPISGPAGVPVRLVGEATTPATKARVVVRAGCDLVNHARAWARPGRAGSLSSGRLMTRPSLPARGGADTDRIDRFDKREGTDRPRSSYLAPEGSAGAFPMVRNFILL